MGAKDWKGYVLLATKNNTKFPDKYIAEGGYNTTPNQREEIKATRDENTRDLIRVTAKGKKTIFTLTLREGLHLTDIETILNFFKNNESDTSQRKINLKYWNQEDLVYKTSDFYRPDLEFKVRQYTDTDIIYNALTLDFVEY